MICFDGNDLLMNIAFDAAHNQLRQGISQMYTDPHTHIDTCLFKGGTHSSFLFFSDLHQPYAHILNVVFSTCLHINESFYATQMQCKKNTKQSRFHFTSECTNIQLNPINHFGIFFFHTFVWNSLFSCTNKEKNNRSSKKCQTESEVFHLRCIETM